MTFSVQEPRKQRTVVLTHSRWEHIVGGHPEVETLGPYVQGAVTSPEIILASLQRPEVELFYKRVREGKSGPLWMKVVVSFAAPDLGEVLTAFLVYNMTGGELLWLHPHLKLI